MYTVDLSLVELGIHEELVAYVADQQDYYAEEGVHVALRDGRAWDHDRLRRTATIGLGRALVFAVTGGVALIPCLSFAQARQHHERYVAPYFTTNGRHDPSVAARALSAVAKAFAVPRVPDPTTIYRTQPPEEKS